MHSIPMEDSQSPFRKQRLFLTLLVDASAAAADRTQEFAKGIRALLEGLRECTDGRVNVLLRALAYSDRPRWLVGSEETAVPLEEITWKPVEADDAAPDVTRALRAVKSTRLSSECGEDEPLPHVLLLVSDGAGISMSADYLDALREASYAPEGTQKARCIALGTGNADRSALALFADGGAVWGDAASPFVRDLCDVEGVLQILPLRPPADFPAPTKEEADLLIPKESRPPFFRRGKGNKAVQAPTVILMLNTVATAADLAPLADCVRRLSGAVRMQARTLSLPVEIRTLTFGAEPPAWHFEAPEELLKGASHGATADAPARARFFTVPHYTPSLSAYLSKEYLQAVTEVHRTLREEPRLPDSPPPILLLLSAAPLTQTADRESSIAFDAFDFESATLKLRDLYSELTGSENECFLYVAPHGAIPCKNPTILPSLLMDGKQSLPYATLQGTEIEDAVEWMFTSLAPRLADLDPTGTLAPLPDTPASPLPAASEHSPSAEDTTPTLDLFLLADTGEDTTEEQLAQVNAAIPLLLEQLGAVASLYDTELRVRLLTYGERVTWRIGSPEVGISSRALSYSPVTREAGAVSPAAALSEVLNAPTVRDRSTLPRKNLPPVLLLFSDGRGIFTSECARAIRALENTNPFHEWRRARRIAIGTKGFDRETLSDFASFGVLDGETVDPLVLDVSDLSRLPACIDLSFPLRHGPIDIDGDRDYRIHGLAEDERSYFF